MKKVWGLHFLCVFWGMTTSPLSMALDGREQTIRSFLAPEILKILNVCENNTKDCNDEEISKFIASEHSSWSAEQGVFWLDWVLNHSDKENLKNPSQSRAEWIEKIINRPEFKHPTLDPSGEMFYPYLLQIHLLQKNIPRSLEFLNHKNYESLQNGFQEDVLKRMWNLWLDTHSKELADWLKQHSENLINEENNSSTKTTLLGQLIGLELAMQDSSSHMSSENILESISKLWIQFPSEEDQKLIREWLDRNHYSRKFHAPLPSKMPPISLLIYAKGLVRGMQGDLALRTIRRVLQVDFVNPSSPEGDAVWDAFQYHIRILRILDRRHEIAETLQNYLKKFKFLEAKYYSDSQRSVFFERLLVVAKHLWNYDVPEKALPYLKQIIDLNRSEKTHFSLAQSLYIQSRIAEHMQETSKALQIFQESLDEKTLSAENAEDLLWRKIFLLLDIYQTKEKSKDIFNQIVQTFKEISKRFPAGDVAKWNYWMGQLYGLSSLPALAKIHFQKAYDVDAFSFYSNLAGLELERTGVKLKQWSLANSKTTDALLEEPHWGDFFKNDRALSKESIPILKAHVYLRLNIQDPIASTLRQFDAYLWKWIPKKEGKKSEKQKWIRASIWFKYQIHDFMGALRLADLLRQVDAKDMESHDLEILYPRAYWKNISEESLKNQIDPLLVSSLIRQESAFNPRAKSIANALGIMQMIPPVASEVAGKLNIEHFEPQQLFDESVSIRLGTRLLGDLMGDFNKSWICVIASYNAGKPPVNRWLEQYGRLGGHPIMFIERISYPETRNYVKSILRNYINYQRIYGNMNQLDINQILRLPPILPGEQVAKTAYEN